MEMGVGGVRATWTGGLTSMVCWPWAAAISVKEIRQIKAAAGRHKNDRRWVRLEPEYVAPTGRLPLSRLFSPNRSPLRGWHVPRRSKRRRCGIFVVAESTKFASPVGATY